LIYGLNRGHLWADRYDRDLDDIFEVQDEVTQKIVGALKIKLAPRQAERKGNPQTSSMEAADAALRARKLFLHYMPQSLN
jgi:adenylate cyclase